MIKNKEDMELWSFTFLDHSIWICKWVSWWCHHFTVWNLNIKLLKVNSFLLKHVKACPHIKNIGVNIILHLFRLDISQFYFLIAEIWDFCDWSEKKWIESCEVMTSSSHLFAYSYLMFKKCFINITNIPYFYLIFMKFLCEIFALFYWNWLKPEPHVAFKM